MKPRVLVADDNANVRTALRLPLESEQMQIDAVATPAEALARCRSNPYDAILIDLNYALDTTSGQEGLQLVAAMRCAGRLPAHRRHDGLAHRRPRWLAAMKGGAAD